MAIAGHCLTISSLLGVGIPVPYLPGKEIKMPKNIYKLKDGTLVPGVTTIINQLDKPALVDWAWKLGKEGKDWKTERDSAGDIGTLVHEKIMSEWTGEPFDLADYTSEQIQLIEKCYLKFDMWACDQFMKEPILIEAPLVSEYYGFGGTPDIYAEVNGKHRLIDIKTSSGIYESHWLQLAAYGILLKVNGYKVDEHQILWLPKDNRFDCPIRTDLRNEKKIFKHLLEIYKLRREQ